jgi:hypothetical protein
MMFLSWLLLGGNGKKVALFFALDIARTAP